MREKIFVVLTIVLTFSFLNSAFTQNKSIEERLLDLEKRVQALESKIGIAPTQSKTPQITEEAIKTAVSELLKKEVPPSWSGSLLGGKNASIEKFEIKQIGNYNEQSKYWPVKCRVVGSCDAEFLTGTKRNSFDKTGDFKIKQDDYGKWRADIDTF